MSQNGRSNPLMDKGINKWVCMYNGKLISIKKEENSHTCCTWMNLKDIMLSGICQSQKIKYGMIPLT